MAATARDPARTADELPLDLLAAIVTTAAPVADELAQPLVTGAFMSAVRALRRLLKSENESIVYRSAEVLARVWMMRYRHRAALKAALQAQAQ